MTKARGHGEDTGRTGGLPLGGRRLWGGTARLSERSPACGALRKAPHNPQEERRNPDLFLQSEGRAMRAAKGAGRSKEDVAGLCMTYCARPRLISLCVRLALSWRFWGLYAAADAVRMV